jgi:hypothetical protein
VERAGRPSQVEIVERQYFRLMESLDRQSRQKLEEELFEELSKRQMKWSEHDTMTATPRVGASWMYSKFFNRLILSRKKRPSGQCSTATMFSRDRGMWLLANAAKTARLLSEGLQVQVLPEEPK